MNRVYYTDTSIFSTPEVFNHFYETVSPFRKAKIDRLQLKGKENSLAVEVLLQKALDDFNLPIGFSQREIGTGIQGKPFLINYPYIHFNLSHAGKRAMCIVSDFECGCDVELIKPERFNLNLVKRFFSFEELKLIEAADENKKPELFFDFWTRKEAFGKMTGMGVNYLIGEKADFSDLDTFQQKNSCYFKLYNLKDEYKYACCSKSDEFSEAMIFMDIRKLLPLK